MDDHYFGTIRQRIASFMKEVNIELWKMGVTAKTQHNEVAPAQHELASIYSEANVAVDNNQLVMQTLKRIACQHGLKCLLHEKPFAGVNGSGNITTGPSPQMTASTFLSRAKHRTRTFSSCLC